MKALFLLPIFMMSLAIAKEENKKVIYEYKKFERFDFDEIGVEGETGAPGDLSVGPTPTKDYANRLPERPDFLKEIRKSASGIR